MNFETLVPTFDINFVPSELHTNSDLLSNMPQNYEPGKFSVEELLSYNREAGFFTEMKELLCALEFLLLVNKSDWDTLNELLCNIDDKISEFVRNCFKLADFLCVDFEIPSYVLLDIFDSKNSRVLTPRHMSEMNILVEERKALWIENERIWTEEERQMNELIENRILEYPHMSAFKRMTHNIPDNWSDITKTMYFRVWEQKKRELDLTHKVRRS